MTLAEEKFHELDRRINLLMEQCRKLKADGIVLLTENKILKDKIEDQQLLIEKLERSQILNEKKITFDNKSDETIKTKQTINEMMREIDQCLLLLEG